MIRFVDVSAAYFGCDDDETPPQKMCAFLSTVDDRFVENTDGEQRLVPDGFWTTTNNDNEET